MQSWYPLFIFDPIICQSSRYPMRLWSNIFQHKTLTATDCQPSKMQKVLKNVHNRPLSNIFFRFTLYHWWWNQHCGASVDCGPSMTLFIFVNVGNISNSADFVGKSKKEGTASAVQVCVSVLQTLSRKKYILYCGKWWIST